MDDNKKDQKHDFTPTSSEDSQNIVTTFDIKSINFREQELEEYFHCILCGAELIYTHSSDFVYQTVLEQAHCPECKIDMKKCEHKLQ